VGLRADARDPHGWRQLPNLQRPGAVVSGIDAVIEPVGFGPVAPTWAGRRQRLGRHASSWSDQDWYLRPLPQDLDPAYFNAAPRDQQTAGLRDNERILLEHLHPEHPQLVTSLPGHHPRAFVERPGRAPQGVPMGAELLWIHTGGAICTVTWRGQVQLESAPEEGTVWVALELPGQTLSWDDVQRLRREAPPGSIGPGSRAGGSIQPAGAEKTMLFLKTMAGPMEPSSQPALPFMRAAAGAPMSPAEMRAARFTATPFARPRPAAMQPAAAMPPAAPSRPAGPLPAPMPPAAPSRPAGPLPPAMPPAARTRPAGPLPASMPPVAQPAAAMPLSQVAPPPTAAAIARTVGERVMQAGGLPREEPAPASAPMSRPGVQPAVEERVALHFVWLDPGSVRRVRRHAPWRPLLEALEGQPLDKEIDDPAFAKEPMDIEDRREVFAILAHAEATGAQGLHDALAAAVREDGRYVPPLRLAAGELIFPFDEVKTLKAMISVVTPFAGQDEALRAEMATAQELFKLADLPGSPAVADALAARIREAWARGKRGLPQGYLEAQTERALLEGRCYQRRRLLGGKHLRALWQPAGAQELAPAYLPAEIAEGLPLYQRFRARLVVELHQQIDQYEVHPIALRVLALARVTPLRRR
jgi:hypothetical protein